MLITYGDADVFTDQLEPMIGKTTSFPSNGDNRMLVENKITLVGELTGCNLAALIAARKQVIDVFADNFKTLVIDGVGSFTDVKIESVNFDESPYLASLPYNITVVHYPDGGYEYGFGIINPKNSFTYTENVNGTLSISQEISAQGINTTDTYPGNGLANAQTFVDAQLDYAIPRPATIDTATSSDFGMYLVDFSEQIDKLNKIITISRTFETDMSAAQGAIILRYTSQITETEGEEVTIAYNGTVDAGRENDLVDARTKYNKFRDDLGETTFINENVTEDPNINKISFSFNCVRGPAMMDDYTITLEENSDSSLFSVSINGKISTRGNCMSDENYASIEAEYNDSLQGHRYDVCQALYEDFYTEDRGSHKNNPRVTLNSNVISKSIGFNEHDQSASYSASYNDRQAMFEMHSFDYTMNFTPALFPIKAVPSSYTKGWIFEDLGYKSRAIISISMNARALGTTVLSHDKFVNLATNQFGKFTTSPSDIYTTVDQYVVNNQKVASATLTKTFHSSQSFTTDENYTTIQTFKL